MCADGSAARPTLTKAECDDLWSMCPKKVGKRLAYAAMKKAGERGTYAAIRDGLARYAAHLRKEQTERRYMMNPTTWFNGDHWLDEYEIGPPKRSQEEVAASNERLAKREAVMDANYAKSKKESADRAQRRHEELNPDQPPRYRQIIHGDMNAWIKSEKADGRDPWSK